MKMHTHVRACRALHLPMTSITPSLQLEVMFDIEELAAVHIVGMLTVTKWKC
jgi:hypothetical protein